LSFYSMLSDRWRSVRLMLLVFLAAALLYVGLGWWTFTVPVSLEDAQACGFTLDDFAPSGRIEYPPTAAWCLSFVRKQEYWSAVCAGLSVAFVAFSLSTVRRLGAGIAAGAAMGGGILALGAICIGCLAPILSVVGLGIGGTLLIGMPKWLMALNTLLLTGWGTLFLSRRLAVCPVIIGKDCTPTSPRNIES
jgi:hypothetical protein